MLSLARLHPSATVLVKVVQWAEPSQARTGPPNIWRAPPALRPYILELTAIDSNAIHNFGFYSRVTAKLYLLYLLAIVKEMRLVRLACLFVCLSVCLFA